MNFLQRFLVWWRAIAATARGTETGSVTSLPPPLIDPRKPTAVLVADAEARGAADARAYTQDSWSFGSPDEPVSEIFDPSYVVSLRHQCETAVQTIQARQAMATSRTAHVRRWRDEAGELMMSARTMMARQAAREARLQEPSMRPGMTENDSEDQPNVARDDKAWEGETTTLGFFWRLLMLVGLVAAELPVQYFVYRYFLGGQAGSLILPLSLSTSLLMVIGPHVAGVLLRSRQATGAERRIGPVVVALAAPWLFVVVVLGLLRGAILDQEHTEELHLAPMTVVLMFIGLLVVIGALAFMLGLARRHPFQEAYVRHRRSRDRLDTLQQTMTEQINQAYLEPDEGLTQIQAEVRAVRASYAAAEEAYFAALIQAMGDPAFTEAVQQRRGFRRATTSEMDNPPPAQDALSYNEVEPVAS